jgi:hypothetical protein
MGDVTVDSEDVTALVINSLTLDSKLKLRTKERNAWIAFALAIIDAHHNGKVTVSTEKVDYYFDNFSKYHTHLDNQGGISTMKIVNSSPSECTEKEDAQECAK